MKKFIYIIFIVISFSSVKAQTDAQIADIVKLENQLDNAVYDSTFQRLYFDLSSKYLMIDLVSSEYYMDKYFFYIRTNDDNEYLKYYFNKSIIKTHKKEYSEARKFIDSAIFFSKRLRDTVHLASIYNNYAFLNIAEGNIYSAYYNLQRAQFYVKDQNAFTNYLLTYNKLFIEVNIGGAINESTIAQLKRDFEKTESSNNYYYLMININLQIKINIKLKKYEEAFRDIFKAYDLNSKVDVPVAFWHTLDYSGDLNFIHNNYSMALDDYKSADTIIKTLGIFHPVCRVKMARTYLKLKLKDKAFCIVDSLKSNVYSSQNNFDSSDYFEQMYLFYSEIGDYKKALVFQQKLLDCNVVIYQKSLSQVTIEEDTHSKVILLNKEIQQLYVESETLNNKIDKIESSVNSYKLNFYIFFILSVIVLGFLVTAVLLFIKRRNQLTSLKFANSILEDKKDSLSRDIVVSEGEQKIMNKQSIISGITDMSVFVINSGSDIIWKNNVASSFFNIYDDFLDSNINNLFNSNISQKIKELVVEVAMNKKPNSIICNLTDKKNKERWINVNVIPFENRDGTDYFGLMCSDITEFKFRENELESQYQMIKNHRDEIKRQSQEIEYQNIVASTQRKDILDSIKYSQRIQLAVYPKDDFLSTLFSDYLLINKPKNILSSCFYWARKKQNRIYVAVGNSNSKDVPGALTSMMIYTILDDVLMNFDHTLSCDIVNELQNQIQSVLEKLVDFDESLSQVQLSLAVYDLDSQILQFSGAKSDLLICSNKNIYHLIGDSSSLNILNIETHSFLNHSIKMEKGDKVYLLSNGVIPMFTGANTIEKVSNVKKMLLDISNGSMKEEEKKLDFYLFESNILKHREDILILGFYIS